MANYKKMMSGRRKNLTKQCVLSIHLFTFCHVVSGQNAEYLEQKAIDYFCILDLHMKISDDIIKFSGKTEGKFSRIYQVAHCIRDINLLKDSIPNQLELDSIDSVNKSKLTTVKRILLPENCIFIQRKSTSFKKAIYSLHVFNAIRYKEKYYVELLLKNKNNETWVICFGFNEENEPSDYCTSYVIF
ncbi:MAG: hypothetical protein LBQ60_01080 [Bacteroidales bacterium]|jgi:hypothetical protein|nr:hypothetical protein [Bacteroidales bacterium]